jgi:hypothetical protein
MAQDQGQSWIVTQVVTNIRSLAKCKKAVLRTRIVILTPVSGIREGKNPEPGSGMNIPGLIFEYLVLAFCVKSTLIL